MTSPTTPRDAIGLSERLRQMPSSLNDACRTMDEAATQLDALSARVKELEATDRYANLISIIADIREKSGLGGKPMLSELADAVEAKIEAAKSRARRAERERDEAYERAAKVAENFDHADTWPGCDSDHDLSNVARVIGGETCDDIAAAIRQLKIASGPDKEKK